MISRAFFSALVFFFLISSAYAAGPEVVKTIPGSSGLTALALDEGTNTLFALNASTSTIFLIDGKKNSLRSHFKVAGLKGNVNMGPDGMAYDPQSGRLFIPGYRNYIYIVDIKSRKVVRELVSKRKRSGGTPSAFFHPLKREVIVFDWTGFIQRFDTDGNLMSEYETEEKDMLSYSLSPDGNFIYAVTKKGITRVNLSKNKIDELYGFDGGGQNMGKPLVDEKKDEIYIGGNHLVVRLEKRKAPEGTRKVVDMKGLDFVPLMGAGMALNQNTRHLFVPVEGDKVAVLDVDSYKIVKELKTGRGPRSIVVNGKTNMVYVASIYDGSITVISDQP